MIGAYEWTDIIQSQIGLDYTDGTRQWFNVIRIQGTIKCLLNSMPVCQYIVLNETFYRKVSNIVYCYLNDNWRKASIP